MTMRTRVVYHVSPRDGNWTVAEEGCPDGQGIYETKDEAVEQARQRALGAGFAHVVVHRLDGSVETEQRYDAPPQGLLRQS
jgi:hypothetical protein